MTNVIELPRKKTFLVGFTNGAIREFSVPDISIYYRHNLMATLRNEKFIYIENVLYATTFINSVEDITEVVEPSGSQGGK